MQFEALLDGGLDSIYFEMAAHANRMAKTLYGRVMHGNDASVRVLEKNGYRFLEEEFGAEDDPYGNGMLVYVYQV